MGNVEQHISQAINNESFASFIGDKKQYIDWKFIALYYSALHYGDAFLAQKIGGGRIKLRDHKQRKDLYLLHLNDDTYTSYERLENFSRIARYHPEKRHILTEKLFNELLAEDYPQMVSLCGQC